MRVVKETQQVYQETNLKTSRGFQIISPPQNILTFLLLLGFLKLFILTFFFFQFLSFY